MPNPRYIVSMYIVCAVFASGASALNREGGKVKQCVCIVSSTEFLYFHNCDVRVRAFIPFISFSYTGTHNRTPITRNDYA